MATLTEARHSAEFVLSEAGGKRSRENITVVSGAGKLAAGQLITRTGGGSASAAAKSGGNTGTGAMTLDATTPVLDGARPGVYAVRCIMAATNDGIFRVESPDGGVIGDVAVGATFADQIKFVIADGGTDFIVGDGFDVTVTPAAGTWAAATATARAEGILVHAVDATSAAVKTVAIVRDAEVNVNCLTYEATIDDATKKARKHAELADAGVIVR